jgi:hypothetical protein
VNLRFSLWLWIAVVAAAAVMLGLRAPRPTAPRKVEFANAGPAIVGVVVSDAGPVAGARVRVQAVSSFTLTDARGRFALPAPSKGDAPARIAAAKDGYVIGGADWNGGPLRIKLDTLPEHDNSAYAWVDPTPGGPGHHNCGDCHEEIYREWKSSGHSLAAVNRRFHNLYDGTNWRGESGHGWSLLDEHPHGAGVCAACHAPTIDFDHPASSDLRRVDGVAAQGVHCDFCHKVQDVDATHAGLTHGRFGMKLLRPTDGQLFFGPLDDVTRDEDVHSPLQTESRFCASCHEGTVFGVHVYSTYSEWLESPARRQGRSCQSCHMAPTGSMTNFAPGAGGLERDPATLASHSFLPGGREAMLRGCLSVEVECRREDETAAVVVKITPHDVGHRIPTGFIDRHVILLVEAVDKTRDEEASYGAAHQGADAPRSPLNPVLPVAVGPELAGKPGRLFAKLLADEQGRPVPFWRSGAEVLDTRLVPERTVISRFQFAPAEQIRVRLLYHRFWEEVRQAKGWPEETIVIYDHTWSVAPANSAAP